MKSYFSGAVFLALGVFLGVVFSGIAMNISAGNIMLVEMKSPFDQAKTVSTIIEKVKQQPGWHVVSVIDQQHECLSHEGQDIGKMTIIKYCNGKVASDMLMADERKKMGAMMPKAFAVYEKSTGQVFVSSANGAILGKLFGGEAERIIERVSLDVENMLRFMNFKFTIF